jgi:hypothetical protein
LAEHELEKIKSNIEEHRFIRAAEVDVEMPFSGTIFTGQKRVATIGWHEA